MLDNCQALAARLKSRDVALVSGGTDTHLLLLNLAPKGVDGARVERTLELINVAANKNTIPGDRSAMRPSGLRVGTPAMTTRGFGRADFEWTADLLCEAIDLTARIQGDLKSKTLAEFSHALPLHPARPALEMLRQRVVSRVSPLPYYSSPVMGS